MANEKKMVLGIPVADVIPYKGMKKMMGERLLKSHLTAAELPVVMREIDVTDFVDLRKRILANEKGKEIRVTFNHLLIKAIAFALQKQPMLNSSLVENEIVIFEEFNIGFAVALEKAMLIVPVIHQVDKKTIWEVAKRGNELTEKTRAGKLGLEDVSKGTFTLTNAGMLGIDLGCGIINQPQSAILTTGRIVDKPAVRNGQIVIRSLMTATISYDHRVLSGEPVGLFLQSLDAIISGLEKVDWGI